MKRPQSRSRLPKRKSVRLQKHPGAVESVVHSAIVAYLEAVLIFPTWFTTIPGGHRRRTTTPGYKSGCPDILIIPPKLRGLPIIMLELKRERGGVVSKKQIECHSDLRFNGVHVAVVRSIDEVRLVFEKVGLCTKENSRRL